jgi:hypothetical protein
LRRFFLIKLRTVQTASKSITTAIIAIISKAKRSNREVGMYLGLDLDTWNSVLVIFMLATAIAALGLVVSQKAIIALQDEAAGKSKIELERYKSDADRKISEANERAAKANLETERLRQQFASRRLSAEQAKLLLVELNRIREEISLVTIFRLGEIEANAYATDILKVFSGAGIRTNVIDSGSMSPPTYGIYISGTGKAKILAAFAAAEIEAKTSPTSEITFPSIVIGLKPPPF